MLQDGFLGESMTRLVKWSFASASVLLAMLIGTRVSADTCTRCGAQTACQTICRLVCEEKKLEVTCWSYKQEEFCLPGPSKSGTRHCEPACLTGPDGTQTTCLTPPAKKFTWTDWIPGWAEAKTRRKLMKQTVTKKIPTTKWTVETLCAECASKPDVADDATSVVVPPPKQP